MMPLQNSHTIASKRKVLNQLSEVFQPKNQKTIKNLIFSSKLLQDLFQFEYNKINIETCKENFLICMKQEKLLKIAKVCGKLLSCISG